jgi:uncharacterized protein YegL
MPTKVADAFAQFQTAKDAFKAGAVVDDLNLVYERALAQKDVLVPDCEDKKLELAHEVKTARNGLKDVENHLTRLQGHMQSVQNGVDRNLAEVEALREQYEAHRTTCQKNKEESAKMLDLLEKDMPNAKKLVEEATAGCKLPSPTPPAVTECSMPNGDFVTTFKDATLRELVTKCSGITEKIAGLTLDRMVRNGRGLAATSTSADSSSSTDSSTSAGLLVQLKSSRLRGSAVSTKDQKTRSKVHKHHRRHRRHKRSPAAPAARQGLALLQKALVHQARSVPDAWCTDVSPAPKCEAITDSMATFLGNVEDLVRDLMGKSQDQDDHCRTSLESYAEQVKALQREAEDGGVEIANAAAEHSEVTTLRHLRRSQVEDVTREAERQVATCGQEIKDFDATMCSASKLKKEMGSLAGQGSFLGDCEVSDWVRGPCSEDCGEAGVQNLTRSVIQSPDANAKCPQLKFERSCNRRPCPVDGQMGGWGPWSVCSRACGTGTQARHRRVLHEARHGGKPTAETMQEQLCNSQACDQDCMLAEWSPWSNCSKACSCGHKSRDRKVVRGALGEGTCPDERSPERLATKPCSKKACNNTAAKCSQELDIALVLDVSGSIGEGNTEKIKAFAKDIIDRTELANAKIGMVYFGSEATIASALTAESADLETKLNDVTWQKDSTNTAQALGLARTLFEDNSRASAQQVVIVVTDGMPQSAFLTGVEVGRLKKEQNARLLFVTVGTSVSQHVVRRWASWPWEENVVVTPDFTKLGEDQVTDVLANLCGSTFKGVAA